MVNATAMVGAARRLAKKKGWRESASDSDSDSGTGKAQAPSAGVVRALHHLITWACNPLSWVWLPGWNLSYARLVESTPSLAGSAGLWGFISTGHLLPDLGAVGPCVPCLGPVERF